MIRMIAVASVLMLASRSAPTNARDELASLRQQAHAEREAGDHAGYLREALRVRTLLNNYPSAILSVARGYMEAGENEKALDALTDFADLGQMDDGMLDGSNKMFAPLAGSARYRAVLGKFEKNKSQVSRSELAFILSDPRLVAEDIDHDAASDSFLITSVLKKKIVRLSKKGDISDFAQSPSGWPMLAIKMDNARKMVWATEVALDGFTAAPKADWGKSAILCFDLRSGKLLRRVEGPAGAALGDMVLDASGDPIVSDGTKGGVYRLRNGNLQLVNGTDFISPQTPAMIPDGRHALVPDYLRGVGVLDLETGGVKWLVSKETALNGVDGLYFEHGSLWLVQNGTSPERVMRIQLDASMTPVVSSEVIERSTPTLGDPTHGVLAGNVFYYIANSGWSELDDHGDLKPGGKLTTAHIMRLKVQQAGPSRF
jgi:sugar lactone lactonase YvrE